MAVEDETAAELADWLAHEHAQLAKAWLGFRRYVRKDVDAFVGDVAVQLGRGELPDPSRVRAARFHTTTDLRSAYRVQTVDELLAELQLRLLMAHSGTDLAPGAAALITRIERAEFGHTWRGGYDYQEVDIFLDRVIEMLSQGHQPGAVPTFTIRHRGYQKRDVDAFTDELRGDLSAK